MPKGVAITLSTNLDLQQSNAVHYKSTDETSKFKQVNPSGRTQRSCSCSFARGRLGCRPPGHARIACRRACHTLVPSLGFCEAT